MGYYGRKYYIETKNRKKVYVINSEDESKDNEMDTKILNYSPTTGNMESGRGRSGGADGAFSFKSAVLYDDDDSTKIVFESKLKPVDFDSIFPAAPAASYLGNSPQKSSKSLFQKSLSLKLSSTNRNMKASRVGVDLLETFSPGAAKAFALVQEEEQKDDPVPMEESEIAAFTKKLDNLAASHASKHASALLGPVASPMAKRLNSAVLFIKPHASSTGAQFVINATLDDYDIRIVSTGKYSAEEAVERRIFSQQYSYIEQFAVHTEPSNFVMTTSELETFSNTFQEGWTNVVAGGRIWNAASACETLHLSAEELYDLWKGAAVQIKLRRGLQICCIDQSNSTMNRALLEHITEPIYIVNGFYPSMREGFCSAESVRYALIEWDTSKLSWSDLLAKVIGHGSPALAPSDSIRGKLLRQWEEIELAAPPDRRDNGVEVSKSSFEGLAERLAWCKGSTLFTDPLGFRLLSSNIPALTVQNWLKNPTILEKCVYDHMFCLDEEECLIKAQSLVGKIFTLCLC